jgi:hypothetical protein
MTTRQFDPVFSAALRNELEALADAPAKGFLPTLRKPQVWISIVTAVVLIAATVGVLQVAHGTQSHPAGRSRVVDPLAAITDPGNGGYVAREVQVLLHVSAKGPGAHDFSVPSGVTSLRIYLNCAPTGHSGVGLDGDGKVSGDCSRESGSAYDLPVTAGTHEVEVTVKKRTDYTLLLMASPAPTVSAGPLIDPLTQVRNLRNPDALVGDTTPLVQMSSARFGDREERFPVPAGVTRMRAYLVCRPSSATTEMRVGTHVVIGCMNSIAHWFDFSTDKPSIAVSVTSPVDWSLLVVPAPKGAKDSPENTLLPLPAPGADQHVLAQARGAGDQVVGTLPASRTGIDIGVTCRGTGWLEVATAQGTIGRGSDCTTLGRFGTGIGGGPAKRGPYTVTPHGDISWTVTISDAG